MILAKEKDYFRDRVSWGWNGRKGMVKVLSGR